MWEDPLEKGKATHSSILVWRIPWTVWSTGSQRVGHEWVTFTFTLVTCMYCVLSCFSFVWLFVIQWMGASQAPLSMRFTRQEYWCRLSCPPPGHLPNSGIQSASLATPALAGEFFFFITSATWEALFYHFLLNNHDTVVLKWMIVT